MFIKLYSMRHIYSGVERFPVPLLCCVVTSALCVGPFHRVFLNSLREFKNVLKNKFGPSAKPHTQKLWIRGNKKELWNKHSFNYVLYAKKYGQIGKGIMSLQWSVTIKTLHCSVRATATGRRSPRIVFLGAGFQYFFISSLITSSKSVKLLCHYYNICISPWMNVFSSRFMNIELCLFYLT